MLRLAETAPATGQEISRRKIKHRISRTIVPWEQGSGFALFDPSISAFREGWGFADPHNTDVRGVTGMPRWCYYTLRRAEDNHPQAHAMKASSAARTHHKAIRN